jgi:hypothetical protein
VQIKLKIQSDRMNPVPDMLLDWDKLSETELKRLVSQLEKTRNDLRYAALTACLSAREDEE